VPYLILNARLGSRSTWDSTIQALHVCEIPLPIGRATYLKDLRVECPSRWQMSLPRLATKSSLMLQCSKCGSADMRRSRVKSAWETWWKQITGKFPCRCGKCGARGWRSGFTARRANNASGGSARAISLVHSRVSDAPPSAGRLRMDELDLEALDIPPRNSHTREFC
jgi:hypothetical protein